MILRGEHSQWAEGGGAMRGGESCCRMGKGLKEVSWESAFWNDRMPMTESHLKAISPQPVSGVRLKTDLTPQGTDLCCEELGTFTVGKTSEDTECMSCCWLALCPWGSSLMSLKLPAKITTTAITTTPRGLAVCQAVS